MGGHAGAGVTPRSAGGHPCQVGGHLGVGGHLATEGEHLGSGGVTWGQAGNPGSGGHGSSREVSTLGHQLTLQSGSWDTAFKNKASPMFPQ